MGGEFNLNRIAIKPMVVSLVNNLIYTCSIKSNNFKRAIYINKASEPRIKVHFEILTLMEKSSRGSISTLECWNTSSAIETGLV